MKAPKLIIDAMEDMVVITGRKDVMEQSLDLHLLPYIETAGFIVTQIHDPVPSRGVEIANAVIYHARRRAQMEGKKHVANNIY